MARKAKTAEVIVLGVNSVSDAGNEPISFSEPYAVSVTIQGSADLLFHRWQSDAVDQKAKAAKNSAAKKTDNVESYVWRDENGQIGLPGEYLRQSIINAAKFRQDPRSPRKSAMDLFKAAVVPLTVLAPFEPGVKKWDYEDRRRVVVQRNGVTRVRPAMRAGWQVTIDLQVLLPEYVGVDDLRSVIEQAGRLVGVGDFRPTYGRFGIVAFKAL